jgi:hypothetical protein
MGEEKKRISILKEPGLFSLIIYPQRDRWKLNILFGWWICWTLCGIIFIANYINYSRRGESMRISYSRTETEIRDFKLKKDTQAQILNDIDKNEKQRLILIVIIAFWAYYEYKVGRAYFYRKFGHEKLWMKNGVLYFKRELNGKGKVKKFDIDFVNEFRVLEFNRNDFFQSVSRSFWTLAGESLAFDFHSKTIPFGIQLEEREAKEISEQLKRALKKAKSELEESKKSVGSD